MAVSLVVQAVTVISASVTEISCTSKPGKRKGSIRKKRNLTSDDRLSNILFFFYFYEPDIQRLSTKSGDDPENWTGR
jgi:hypothetical protein